MQDYLHELEQVLAFMISSGPKAGSEGSLVQQQNLTSIPMMTMRG